MRAAPGSLVLLGFLALFGWAAHALDSLFWRGEPESLLWACNLGAFLAAVGLLRRWPAVNGIGVAWLAWGLPLWALDLALGGEFILSSLGTHIVALGAGIAGLSELGMPRGTWWRSVLALIALQQLCRWVTAPRHNVNAAFAVWAGWEGVFASYPVYWTSLVALGTATFLAAELGFRRWACRASSRAEAAALDRG